MGWRMFGKRAERTAQITGPDGLIPPRPDRRRGLVHVTNDTAMRHSAVWACLRLRADLVSTMPVDVYRRVAGVQVEVPTPPVLVTPGGERVGIQEWLYSSQFDLDRGGNCFGLITAKDGLGFPARIDLSCFALFMIGSCANWRAFVELVVVRTPSPGLRVG